MAQKYGLNRRLTLFRRWVHFPVRFIRGIAKFRIEYAAMNIEELRNYCIRKPEVTEGFPFDSETLVFKVAGKMFLLVSLDESPLRFNVKCDPELAIELREKYPCVRPGFHMNKSLWNTVTADGSVGAKLLQEWIDHSYAEVVKKLPKKDQARLREGALNSHL
ncbi:MAG: MmcQ/YjbR family DNA-binding protein [Bacteroidota bacterium]|jgi:predicted DNA-binding protein (MmcQ/YjbR family)